MGKIGYPETTIKNFHYNCVKAKKSRSKFLSGGRLNQAEFDFVA